MKEYSGKRGAGDLGGFTETKRIRTSGDQSTNRDATVKIERQSTDADRGTGVGDTEKRPMGGPLVCWNC